jgi:hypothetical protein
VAINREFYTDLPSRIAALEQVAFNPPPLMPGFGRSDREWRVLACKTAGDIGVSGAGETGYNPWQVAGETTAAPTGANDEGSTDLGNGTTDSAAETITINNHGLLSGQLVQIYNSGAGLAGFSANTAYWVMNPTTNTFQLSATLSPLSAFNITASIAVGVRLSSGAGYLNPGDIEPGHAWPFMNWSSTTKGTSDVGSGYFPASLANDGNNHYRRFCRLAPGMFGSAGACIRILMSGLVRSSIAAGCLDIVIHPNLVTSVSAAGANTTAFDANKRIGMRWALGLLHATNEYPFMLDIVGHAMGPYKSIWGGRLVVDSNVAGSDNSSADPTIDKMRGPIHRDLTTAAINMDTQGALLAFLFAGRSSTASTVFDIGSTGTGGTQDGTVVRVRGGAALALLSPGQ